MTLSDQEMMMLEQIELLIRRGYELEAAAAKIRVMVGNDPAVDRVISFRHEMTLQTRTIAINDTLIDPAHVAKPWYTGPNEGDIYWPRLREKLEGSSALADAVTSIDQASNNVVSLLPDPHGDVVVSRGLVVGYVQSGKTANFTATIAKAADCGYRMFIVLSGVHNSLRRQTQVRLDGELRDLNPKKWIQMTSEDQDFGNPMNALPLLANDELRLISVVKKNVSRLNNLNKWLQKAGGALENCPVLVIDDESDQASPNAAKNPELNRTRINELITNILALPKVAYVGYTATPFANVLINPADERDIYPRSFIYALPKPAGYFGSEDLFGGDAVEEEETESGAPHDMIRIVPDDEALLHKATRGSLPTPRVTPSLDQAIRWFFLATAARRVRTGMPSHSSMLVHTTMRIEPQIGFIRVIKQHIQQLGADLFTDRESWRSQWAREQLLEPSSRHGLHPVTFDELWPVLPDVIADAMVVADNSRSTERLIYTDEPATVVAVGGNTLSRGLTLEGLVSSFFLRSSNTYDSLLQMGRWFGYRPGYADLPRIWTTRALADLFRFLSQIEREVRRDIDRYRIERVSPSELAVKIRTHPSLQVTARNKMYFAVPGEASYSGQHPQTTYFHHKDVAEIQRNKEAAMELVRSARSAGSPVEIQDSRVIIKGVSVSNVLKFIDEFAFHPDTDLASEMLRNYINAQRVCSALEVWNIAIISRNRPSTEMDLGLDSPVRTISRSRLRNSGDEQTANIGTLSSRPDRVADLIESRLVTKEMSDENLVQMRTDSGRGLVLLYPIDKDSAPSDAKKYRAPLEAIEHLVGVSFSFPKAEPGSEPMNAITVKLPVEIHEPGDDDQSDAEEFVDDEGDMNDVEIKDA